MRAFLLVATLVGCVDDPAIDDVDDDLPGLEGEWRDDRSRPIEMGNLALGVTSSGTFTQTRGWVGHRIYLAQGAEAVFDAWGTTAAGTEQDTMLWVYGPQRPDGSFPLAAIAHDDDANAPSSQLRLTMHVEGTYRVVVSTFANWQRYPTNVSTGTWNVRASCVGWRPCTPLVVGR